MKYRYLYRYFFYIDLDIHNEYLYLFWWFPRSAGSWMTSMQRCVFFAINKSLPTFWMPGCLISSPLWQARSPEMLSNFKCLLVFPAWIWWRCSCALFEVLADTDQRRSAIGVHDWAFVCVAMRFCSNCMSILRSNPCFQPSSAVCFHAKNIA